MKSAKVHIQIVGFVPILVLASVSVYLQRNRIALLMPIYIIVLSQWVTYSLFMVAARYRSHVDVFLILLAAPALISIGRKIKEAIILRRKCDHVHSLIALLANGKLFKWNPYGKSRPK